MWIRNTGIHDSNRVTEDRAWEHRRRGRRRSTEERMYNEGLQERTNEERRVHVTRSGRMYNRMERDTEIGGLSLCNKVRQGSEYIMKKMDRQEISTEEIKRIVREGLMTLSDTVEREMTGMSERMGETVKRNVEVEVAEIKAMVERLEERAKRKEELVMERMRKQEERLKESEDKETKASKRLEDRLKEKVRTTCQIGWRRLRKR